MAPSVDAVLGDKDLLKSIFDQLDLREICNAAATCLLWYQVANHDDFWKQIDFRGKRVLPENAAALLRRHPKVEELDLSGLDGSHTPHIGQPPVLSIRSFVLQVAPHLTNLRKLTFSARCAHMDTVGPLCPIANHLVAQLSSFSSLTCLNLSGMSIVNGSGVHGDLAHSGLKQLVLDNTESSGVTVRCPELTFLSMAGAANTRMPNLVEAPALQSLDLSRCSKLAEASTRTALMRLTALQQLNISGISNFLDQTIQQLATSLEQLTWLDMSRVTAISFQGVRGFAALQHLDISRCESLNTGAVTTALESFECLQSLVLDGCNLQNIKLSMPKLKDLSIRGCHALAELEIRAWQLSRLDLGPVELSGQANHTLAKLTLTSGALRRMEWNKLNKLSTVDLDCPTLAELVVRDCNFPDPSVLQSLGDTAHAPTLKSDVFDTARKSAFLSTKPCLTTTSSFGMGITRSLGEAAEQGHMGWLALGGDDDFEMEDLDLEEGPDQPLPGQEDDEYNVNDDDNDSDDGDDEEGDGPGHGGGGARGGRGHHRRCRARPTASWVVRGHSEDRPRHDEGWQGPDKLPRELVRFGNVGRQASAAGSGNAGASSSAAAAAAPAAAPAAPFGDAGAGPSSSSAPLGAGSSQGTAAAQAAPTPAAATGPSGAGGSQRARPGSVSDTLGAGFDWLWSGVSSSSRGLLSDRRFIWGSSGDRLQQVAPTPSQQAASGPTTRSAAAAAAAAAPAAPPAAAAATSPAAAAATAPAAAAAGDGPELGRAREDEDTSDFSKCKAQRLEGTGAQRLSRASADAAGPSRSPQQQQQPPQPPALRQQRLQHQRRRQRWGGLVRLTRQEPGGRWQVTEEARGSQPSPSAAAAAAGDADDGEGWMDGLASAAMSPGPAGGWQPSSQQDWQGNSQQSCRRRRRVGMGGSDDSGDDDDDGSSSESDAGADTGAGGAAGGAAAAAGGDRGVAPKPPRRSSITPGKGGVPRLRVLHVEGCERLQELQLSHLGLEQVVVAGCNSLVVVALHAPRLTALELQELGELKGACLQEVSVPGITMGSCSSLQGIELSSKVTVRLDVRGCGGLQQLHLDCPALQVLDANFCGSLSDEGLASAVANLPPLRQLALSVCCQIGSSGLSSLSQLTTLQELDLSYTEVSTLQPILDSCPALQSLSIASCRSLGRDALLPLLDPQQQALMQLTSLDASYCDVQDQLVAQLLLKCRKLKHLALSGCAGVTDAIWQQVEGVQLQQVQQRGAGGAAAGCVGRTGACRAQCAAGDVAAAGAALMDLDGDDSQAMVAEASWGPEGLASGVSQAAGGEDAALTDSSSLLESLSLVRCSNLRSLCLGLLPASGRVELLSAKQYLLSGGRAALQEAAPAAAQGSWVEVPSAVSELTSLKLGLSGVQVVALALPRLAHLDLSSCKHLRLLELRCPLLLQLQLQACRSLPVVSAVKGVLGAPHLQMLDVQHMLPSRGGCGQLGRTSVSGWDTRNSSDDSTAADDAGSWERSGVTGAIEVDCNSSAAVARSRGLLAAVAATGDLPKDAAGQGTDAQVLHEMLHEVAATHASLKAGGILRCTSVCKVCSKLAQCSL